MPISFSSLSGGGGAKSVTKIFNASGSWTAPADVDSVELLLVGGGGGGGGTRSDSERRVAGGGGGGQVLHTYTSVTPGSNYAIVIGAGGAAGPVSANSNFATQAGQGGITKFTNDQNLWAWGGLGGSGFTSNSWDVTNAANNFAAPLSSYSEGLYGSMGGQGIGGNNDYSLGTRGGGAGSPSHVGYNLQTVFTSNNQVSTPTSSFSGAGGATSGRGNESAPQRGLSTQAMWSGGGAGVMGYGGGGGGSYLTTQNVHNNNRAVRLVRQITGGIDGGGNAAFALGGTSLTENANSGTINRGAGGGGALRYGPNGQTYNSGSGGSGVLVIKYTTAEE